jgi:phospholipid/cholesterol/gamma-HCH transport system substrate-binding protein
MMGSPLRDLLVGSFVLAGLLAIGYLSINLGGGTYTGPGGLVLHATFDEVGGLAARAPVVIGGVKVGQVKGLELAPDFRAKVTLDLDRRLQIPDDSSASILTAGVLGDQYVAVEPGGSETFLASGDEIEFTQSALILERLIGKMVQNLGSDGDEK